MSSTTIVPTIAAIPATNGVDAIPPTIENGHVESLPPVPISPPPAAVSEVDPLTPYPSWIGFAIVIGWLVVFVAGMSIDSNPLRKDLAESRPFTLLYNLGVILISYTATSAAILSVLSGMAGSFAHRIIHRDPSDIVSGDAGGTGDAAKSGPEARSRAAFALDPEGAKKAAPVPDPSPDKPLKPETLTSGAIRSFAVYLVYLAGVSVGANDPIGATTPDQFARVVGAISLAAFVASFHPALFSKVIGRATRT